MSVDIHSTATTIYSPTFPLHFDEGHLTSSIRRAIRHSFACACGLLKSRCARFGLPLRYRPHLREEECQQVDANGERQGRAHVEGSVCRRHTRGATRCNTWGSVCRRLSWVSTCARVGGPASIASPALHVSTRSGSGLQTTSRGLHVRRRLPQAVWRAVVTQSGHGGDRSRVVVWFASGHSVGEEGEPWWWRETGV